MRSPGMSHSMGLKDQWHLSRRHGLTKTPRSEWMMKFLEKRVVYSNLVLPRRTWSTPHSWGSRQETVYQKVQQAHANLIKENGLLDFLWNRLRLLRSPVENICRQSPVLCCIPIINSMYLPNLEWRISVGPTNAMRLYALLLKANIHSPNRT